MPLNVLHMQLMALMFHSFHWTDLCPIDSILKDLNGFFQVRG